MGRAGGRDAAGEQTGTESLEDAVGLKRLARPPRLPAPTQTEGDDVMPRRRGFYSGARGGRQRKKKRKKRKMVPVKLNADGVVQGGVC